MSVCMYVCMSACLYVCTYVCMYVSRHLEALFYVIIFAPYIPVFLKDSMHLSMYVFSSMYSYPSIFANTCKGLCTIDIHMYINMRTSRKF